MSGELGDIRALVLDVDGVLTDGSIWLSDSGEEMKRFSVRDGLALSLWVRSGRGVALVTGRSGLAVSHRARELGIAVVIAGCGDKGDGFERAVTALKCEARQVAVVGDDLPDLPMLRRCGYPVAVGDACAEVRAAAQYTTRLSGGYGAVRETVEHLLQGCGEWPKLIAQFEATA